MFRVSLKNLLGRKLRLVLSASAVVIGVAFVAGTLILTDTLNKVFDDLFSSVTKNTSVEVRAKNALGDANGSGAPLAASLLPKVRAVGGVKAADGRVSGYAQIIDPGKKKAISNGGAPGLGINWTSSPLSVTKIVKGAAPRGADQIAIDQATFDSAHLKLGERVLVISKRTPKTYSISGYFTLGGATSVGGATLTAFDTPVAQAVLMEPGQFAAIDLGADSGVSQETLRGRVAKVLPAGIEAVTGKEVAKENSDSIKQGISGFSTFLLVFAGISLFVGAFIIFNTFTMLIAQRVRELALLRALGASRRQVRRSVLIEAVAVGFVGATIGLGLGVLLAIGLRALIGAFGVTLPSGPLVFAGRTAIASYLIGIVITAVAAYVPARKAATVPPVAAMRESYVLPARSLRSRAAIGVVVTAVGFTMVILGLFSHGSGAPTLVGLGAGLSFIGVATISPLISRPVTRVIGAPLPRLFGATGRIGLDNAMRNPRRTSATASALMIGLALVSTVAVLGSSLKQSTKSLVEKSIGADYVLTAGGFGTGFTPAVATTLRGKPGIALASGLRAGVAQVGGEKTGVVAGDPTALPPLLSLKRDTGNLGGLADGTVLVDQKKAKDKGYVVGTKIPVIYPQTGRATLTVVGTFATNQLAGDYLVSLGEYSRHFNDDLDVFVLVKSTAGADPATVRATIDRAVAPFPNVDVRDQTQFVKQQQNQVNLLLGFVYVLLAFAIVIAVVGVVNTLALSVIERTREIGLLRAVGTGRGQLWGMITLESVVISVFGALLGVVVGSFFGWALVRSLRDNGLSSFAYPVTTVILVLVVSGLLGVVAALLPARRAARMDVLRAIATT